MRVHADVPKVSQEYIGDAAKLRDRPRMLLFATRSGKPRPSVVLSVSPEGLFNRYDVTQLH